MHMAIFMQEADRGWHGRQLGKLHAPGVAVVRGLSLVGARGALIGGLLQLPRALELVQLQLCGVARVLPGGERQRDVPPGCLLHRPCSCAAFLLLPSCSQ